MWKLVELVNTKSLKSWSVVALKIAVAVALLFVLIKNLGLREQIMHAFRSANWLLIVGAFLLIIPNLGIAIFKWRFLLRLHYPDLPTSEAWGSYMAGSTLGLITPGSLGELARGLFFKSRDRSLITGLNVADKIFNMIIFLTVGFLALNQFLFYHIQWPHWVLFPVAILSFLFILSVLGLALHPEIIGRFLNPWSERMAASSRLRRFLASLAPIRSTQSLQLLALSAAYFLVISLQYHLLVNAFSSVTFGKSLLAVASIIFVKLFLPIAFGDLGIRESAAVFFYSYQGVPAGAAFNASILIFLINVVLPAILGYAYVLQIKLQLNSPIPFQRGSLSARSCSPTEERSQE